MLRNALGFVIAIGFLMLVFTFIGLRLARLGVDDPEVALVPAVVIAWLLDGIGGGLFAVLVAALTAWFFFIPPTWAFALPNFGDLLSFSLFLVVTVFVCLVVQAQKERIQELVQDNRLLNRKLIDTDDGHDHGVSAR